MSSLSFYQSSTAGVGLSFTDTTGGYVNMSGVTVDFVAKRNWSDPLSEAVMFKSITGDATAVSGQMTMYFTTGDTSICVGSYRGGFFTIDSSTGVSPFNLDDIYILSSPMGYSP